MAQAIADQPFDEWLHDRLLQPLGMADTHFYLPEDKRPRRATIYGVADLAEADFNIARIIEIYGEAVPSA